MTPKTYADILAMGRFVNRYEEARRGARGTKVTPINDEATAFQKVLVFFLIVAFYVVAGGVIGGTR
jgi:hypothetical protein